MLNPRLLVAVCLLGMLPALAQETPPDPTPSSPAPAAGTQPADIAQKPEDKRMFGVLPNNRTADGSIPFEKISAKRKMTIAAKDSFDYPIYATAAIYSIIYQAENQNPSFGQGMEGYAKRLGTSLADQMIGNMMTEGVMPSLLHHDPRYFRLGYGNGSFKHRLLYAVAQTFSTKTDRGTRTFNFSEWSGNAVAVAFSNVYYPDTRTAHDNVQKLLIQCGTDTLSNVLKEFYPDIKRKFHRNSGAH
jgi:hypothetical protein